MVVLNRIYTRTGDAGETSLVSGARVPKYDLRVEAYGTVDETNACIGLARLHVKGPKDEILGRIQNELFDLGADLATPETEAETTGSALRVTKDQVARLESEIDRLNEDLAPLRSFVLPGGTPAAAYLHLARAVARRAERLIVALAAKEPVSRDAMAYVNRLSDLLFVLARHANAEAAGDVLWVPGKTREP